MQQFIVMSGRPGHETSTRTVEASTAEDAMALVPGAITAWRKPR